MMCCCAQSCCAILRQLKSYVELSSVRIAWGTKGLDPLSQQFLHEVVADELGDTVPSAIISDPVLRKRLVVCRQR